MTTQSPPTQHEKIQEFIAELSGFAATAEKTLEKIEEDLEGNKGLFSVFSQRMIAIRGTADQLSLAHIAHIAGLGEEIAVKGIDAASRPAIRKCVGSLWDALTTVKHLLVHYNEETGEEQAILVNRLESTLKALGGQRLKVDADEIAKLLSERG
jgi:hypothetical protein